MPHVIRVLHLEDDEYWRFKVEQVFQDQERFRLTSVERAEEARILMDETFFHILVIDIELRQDRALRDEGGINFVRDISSTYAHACKVIFLSQYTSHIREAFRDLRAADYIDKMQFIKEFADAVGKIRSELKINERLEFQFHRGLSSMEGLVSGLKYRGIRLSDDSPLVGSLAEELEDLLRRVFANETSILLESVGKGGFSGAGIVRCRPFSEVGGSIMEQQTLILKFGDALTIKEENDNYNQCVAPFQIAAYATHIDRAQSSFHLGALLYSFVGMQRRAFDDFDTFFTAEPTSIEQINQVLEILFRERLGGWHSGARLSPPMRLEEEYHRRLKINARLDEISDHIQTYIDGGVLRLENLPPLPDPRPRLKHPEKRFEQATLSIAHGDLNERNILIDRQTLRPWLIDFATTKPDSPLLSDFAQLEMSIRIELLRDKDIPLSDRYRMEEMLTHHHASFDALLQAMPDRLPWSAHPMLEKAYQSVRTVRRLALAQARSAPESKLYEYYVALFYHTINGVRYRTFSRLQRQHAMLSSALLARALDHV